jgi:hypothetical protein
MLLSGFEQVFRPLGDTAEFSELEKIKKMESGFE